MNQIDVPVLIIGGGGCGLSSSIFLSDLGVEHILLERHPSTSHLPKAHYLNQRTMEILRQHGVADAVYAVSAPVEKMCRVSWQTSLGGTGPLNRRVIHEMDVFGGGSLRERYRADSPCDPTNHPQQRLEPILRAEAERRGPGRLLFHCELVTWEQTSEGVVAQAVNHATGEKFTVKARYVIAADGGKTVGAKLGIPMVGFTNVADFVSTHFSADLSEYWDDRSLIAFFVDPEGDSSWGAGALVQMGPTWGKHSEEWVLHFGFRHDDANRFNEATLVPKIRELLRVPDLKPQVHRISHWVIDRVVAERWRVGNVFLAGDAAHRHPPSTGLGLNLAIADAHNLTWKLAAVLKGQADAALLDSYETERKPVGTHCADWSLMAFMNRTVTDAGIGLLPGAPPAMNTGAFYALFEDSAMGVARRARAKEAFGTQRMEFQAHDIELGYTYEGGAVVADGSPPVARSPLGTDYTPTTRPGHRLPHAWLTRRGQRISTHDLATADGALVLITGAEGDAWAEAATVVARELNVVIRPVKIGPRGEYTDATGDWGRLSEIGEGGALLVRPDNHVAFRTRGTQPNAEQVLRAAIQRVLRGANAPAG